MTLVFLKASPAAPVIPIYLLPCPAIYRRHKTPLAFFTQAGRRREGGGGGVKEPPLLLLLLLLLAGVVVVALVGQL
jgi:hypothetical protein